MYSDLKDIKRLRKYHGLTQAELAKLAGVSQSLIAKIEAGTLDPTFSRTQKIFGVLESLDTKSELQAKDVMVSKLISCEPSSSVIEAVQKMHKHGISQIPVVKEGNVVGFVSENTILEMIAKPKHDIASARIIDVMQDAPPIISEHTGLSAITPLLRYFPIVIVRKKEKITGVITKADMLHALSK